MKTFTVKLDIGSVTSLNADGYESGAFAVKFYRGSSENVIATYARSMVKEITERENSTKTELIDHDGSRFLQGLAL